MNGVNFNEICKVEIDLVVAIVLVNNEMMVVNKNDVIEHF